MPGSRKTLMFEGSMSPSQSGSHSSTAPVTELAHVLMELLRREAEVDRRELEDGEEQDTRAELWRQTNLQAIDGIEQAIASLAATELSEAAVQILIAGGYANEVAEELEDPRLREPVTRLARLLRSALPVIVKAAGVDLEAYAVRRYAQSGQDWPFPPTEPDETSGNRSASAEPQCTAGEDEAQASGNRPAPLGLSEPELENPPIDREGAGEGAPGPRRDLQNEIVLPILDMLFAEAGCSTRRRVNQA